MAIWEMFISPKLLSVYQAYEIYYRDKLLHIFSKEGYKEVLEKLLQLPLINAQVNTVDRYGYTPLHYAILKGHLDVIHLLMKCNHINPNMRNKNGFMPIQIAILKNQPATVKLFIASDKIDLNKQDKQYKTPLNIVPSKDRFIKSMILAKLKKYNNGHKPVSDFSSINKLL
ncbi:MAG: ankyrin repeat domain-containing protein [Amoebophilaceae bacterium]|nr:ankyrin repeat domain-containing protein [Amoebophilaceae bacterium]